MKPIMGVPVYQEKDYEKLKEIFQLPSSYEQWLKGTERGIKELSDRGYVVERVNIDIDVFSLWCKDRGLDVNKNALKSFVHWFIYEKHHGQR